MAGPLVLSAALTASLLSGCVSPRDRRIVATGLGATTPVPEATPTPQPPLSETEVAAFVKQWPAFNRAMDALDRVARTPPSTRHTDPEGLEDAAVAREARPAMEKELAPVGTTPERFLALYRRVASAWWAMVQEDERKETDAALESEVAEMKRVAGHDPAAGRALEEMEKADHELHTTEIARPAEVPARSIEVVRQHRAELSRIFAE